MPYTGSIPTYIGIVGTRSPKISYEEFSDIVENHTITYPLPIVIVSGGAQGIDTYAKNWSRNQGSQISYLQFLPDLFSMSPRTGEENMYFKRNELIATVCDHLIAFPAMKDNEPTGGTLNTINHAVRLNKQVSIHYGG